MIVLAVLLRLRVALAVLFILVSGSTTHLVLAWHQVNLSWGTTALLVFLSGAVTLLVAEIGVGLLLRGNRRNWARRQELKRLRKVEAERSRTPTGARPTAPGTGTSTTGQTTTGQTATSPATSGTAAPAVTEQARGSEPQGSGSTATH